MLQCLLLIDLAFTSAPENVTGVTVVELEISDHKSVLLKVQVSPVGKNKKLTTFRSMRNYNEDAMKLDFLTADWQPVYNANCVDSKWKEWLRIWNSIVDKHCPLITKPVKSNPTPWLHGNAELREVIQRRNGAHSTADRSGSPEDWTAYHDLRRQASQLITDAKSGFFSSLLDNRKNIWPDVRKYILQKKAPPTLSHCQNSTEEEVAFADRQNQHFSSTASRVSATIRPADTSGGVDDRPRPSAAADTDDARTETTDSGPRPPRVVSSAFKLMPATLPELSRALRAMNNSKACGEDGVSLQLLKTVFPVVGPHLLHLINYSIVTGTVPVDWKFAVIVPLHKKGATDDPRNFRPISLLSNVAKLCEKIVTSQLSSYLVSNCILNDAQHAYIPGHSTETALATSLAFITSRIDAGEVVSLASVDLSSAFDCVNHEILLQKLGWYGIDSTWFRDYLSNRQQRVRGGSCVQRVDAGVPQGSLTGPILFLLYTNDIPCHIDCKTVSYADDAQFLVSSKASELDQSITKLELNLAHLESWYQTNHLKLNSSKTQFVMFCTRQMQRQLPTNITLKIGDAVVTPASSLKNLGVIMDRNLSWDEHVSETAQKCNKIIFPLAKHSHSLSEHVLGKLMETLVIPHLSYCAPVWGGLCANQRQRLQKVINRAARVVTKTPRSAHITPVLTRLGWRSIKDIVKRKDATLVHHAIHSPCAPVSLKSLFKLRTAVSERRTRAKRSALELPPIRTELARHSLPYRAAALWNSLPEQVTDVDHKSFKALLPF